MAVTTYTKAGAKATTPAKLDKAVFGVEAKNHELLKSAYVAYLANGRGGNATSKTRGLVSGGGRKPWKQKGTGRARFGSSRNPIWRGGGVVFGPTGNENYSHSMHTKAKRQALRQALSIAATENRLIVIEAFDIKDGKTSTASKLLQKVGAEGNILLALTTQDDTVVRSINNLNNIKLVQATYLNVYDLINADTIVISTDGLKAVHDWLTPAKTATKEAPASAKATEGKK